MKSIILILILSGVGIVSCTKKEVPDTSNASTTAKLDVESSITHKSGNLKDGQKPICEVDFSVEKLPLACTEGGRYQAIFFNGQKSGYAISGRKQIGHRVENCEFSNIVMKRGAVTMQIQSITNMVETQDGKPLGYTLVSEETGMSKQACGVFRDNQMHIRTISSGYEATKVFDWQTGMMMQEGIRLLAIKHGMDKGAAFVAKGFDAESEGGIEFDYEVIGKEKVDLLGKMDDGIKVRVRATQNGGTMETIEWLDENLETLRSEASVMGMKVETILCEKEYALVQDSPAEIFTASFLDSPIPLTKRKLRGTLEYSLQAKQGHEVQFPTSVEQKSSISATGRISLVVAPKEMPRGLALGYAGKDKDIKQYLEPNSWIQSDAASIISLSKKAVGKAKDIASAARNIEAFVADYISNRSLSVGYASAIEVLENRQGDCTEFALLTAALARAAGIPARVVFGIVYVKDEFEGRSNFFGGHAWTQVFVGENWYSLDAAFGEFDSGHIAIDYNNGEPSNFFKLITTMGNFDLLDIVAAK